MAGAAPTAGLSANAYLQYADFSQPLYGRNGKEIMEPSSVTLEIEADGLVTAERPKFGFIFHEHPLMLELFGALVDRFQRLGFSCYPLKDISDCSADLRLVVLFGLGHYVPNSSELLDALYALRVRTVLWQIEALPPAPLNNEAMKAAEILTRISRRNGIWKVGFVYKVFRRMYTERLISQTSDMLDNYSGIFTKSAIRMMCQTYQWLGEKYSQGRISEVAVSLTSRLHSLQGIGIAAQVRPVGYHPIYGRMLSDTDRDIDVLYLGGMTPRRAAIIKQIEEPLKAAGYAITIPSTACYGEDRTRLLNRTKILLNINNYPWELAGMRLVMAMSCGSLVVSEDAPDPRPYRPGEHFVMAKPESLAETLLHYLASDAERCLIAQQGYDFVVNDFRIENIIVPWLDSLARANPNAGK